MRAQHRSSSSTRVPMCSSGDGKQPSDLMRDNRVAARTWILVLAAAVGPGPACLFPPEPQPDGADCESDDECESGTCFGGRFCAFSTCTNTSYCESGFRCEEPALWQEVVSLGLVRNRCVPECSQCPPDEDRWSCGGDDQCHFDPRPVVEVHGSSRVELGQRLTLEAVVDLAPGREVDTVSWTLGGDVVGEQLTLEIEVDDPQPGTIVVSVTDDDGSLGSASTELMVCSPLAGPCQTTRGNRDCCDPSHECRDDEGRGQPTCSAP